MPISTIGSNSLNQTSDLTINGQTVGKGGGNVATNTAHGISALNGNSSGTGVTAIGSSALPVSTASNNTAVGRVAGNSTTSGSDNTFLGMQSGYTNVTGVSNVYAGVSAGYTATSSYNTFVGQGSGELISSGTKNTILGRYNGNQGSLDIRTSSNNIVLSDGDGNIKFSASASFFSLNGFNADGDIGGTPATTTWSSNLSDGVRCNQPGTSYWNRASDGNVINWRKAGTSCGNISVSGTSTTYGTSSDYRLKENITPMTGALAKVAQLKPVTYTWKEDGKPSQGFIAHEIQAIVPECVVGEKDAVDKDGNPDPQNLDTSFLVATLTAAIQELKTIVDAQAELISGQAATINALVTRIEALENRA